MLFPRPSGTPGSGTRSGKCAERSGPDATLRQETEVQTGSEFGGATHDFMDWELWANFQGRCVLAQNKKEQVAGLRLATCPIS